MKQIDYIFSIFLLAAVLSGCSKFDQFISGLSGDIVAPITVGDKLDSTTGIDYLVDGLIRDRYVDDISHLKREVVLIINDQTLLHDVTYRGNNYSWPEMNLQKYSLVVVRLYVADGGSYLANHRIEKQNDQLFFYPEIKSNGGTQQPGFRLFATLYPKLPDLPVEIVHWETNQ